MIFCKSENRSNDEKIITKTLYFIQSEHFRLLGMILSESYEPRTEDVIFGINSIEKEVTL